MFSTDWWCFVLLILRLFGVRGSVSICDYRSKNEVIIFALVNVHDEGTNCAKLSLRGLQQMAVLEKSVREINDKDESSEGLHLALHIVDTCSSSNNELKDVLKTLVVSHQTCLNPPLLLGFIGPERHLRSTQLITSEFHKFHVLPFEPDWKVSSQPNNLLLHVGNRRLQLRSKIVLSILNQLKWRSVYVLVGDNIAISEVLEHILNEIEHVCVTGLEKIPNDASAISSFYSTVQKRFEETESDGLIVFAEDPNNIRPFLRAMENPAEEQTSSSAPFLFYLIHVGLKSWELPRNHTILLLQETSDVSKGFDLRAHHNQTLWNEYYQQYDLDYKRDAFADQYDSSVAPFEYALQLYWNAAKYAKKIKCDLGSKDVPSAGVCKDMLHASPSEWKTFLLRTVYHHSISLRKISFEMNAPVVVKVYFVNRIVNFPQLIGRITDIGIMDMKMDLHTAIPSTPKNNLRKCIPPPTKKDSSFNPFPMDHESNWLAVFSKKMKNLIQLDGWVSRETNDKINNAVSWFLGFVMFILGLILITKCVYTIFRVQTEDERTEARRRKTGRTSRIVST